MSHEFSFIRSFVFFSHPLSQKVIKKISMYRRCKKMLFFVKSLVFHKVGNLSFFFTRGKPRAVQPPVSCLFLKLCSPSPNRYLTACLNKKCIGELWRAGRVPSWGRRGRRSRRDRHPKTASLNRRTADPPLRDWLQVCTLHKKWRQSLICFCRCPLPTQLHVDR